MKFVINPAECYATTHVTLTFRPESPCAHRHCRRNPLFCGRCHAWMGCKEVPQAFGHMDRCGQCAALHHLSDGLRALDPSAGRRALATLVALAGVVS